jgi:hypothetical protein
MAADGEFHADGDVVAHSSSTSDERLKTNIRTLQNALDKVNSIRGVEFEYLKDGREGAGVIAQELLEILPSAVSENGRLTLEEDDEDRYYTVEYSQLTALFIEAIKELTERLENLESKQN